MSWVSDSYREHKQKWLNFQPVELDPMLIRQRLGALSPETEWPNPHLEPVVAKRVRASAKRSAVAIILRDQPELPIVLTQRSAKIRFGGQWCFPGGREAGSDDSLRTAALRETEEEIGLLGEDMTWLGCLGHYYTQSGFLIEAHVFKVEGNCNYRFNPEEVADLVEVPIKAIQNPDHYYLIGRGHERANFQFRWQSVQIGGPTVSLLIHLMRCLSGLGLPRDRIASRDKLGNF